MIPAHEINPRALGYLAEYLRTEAFRALADRRPLEERWLKYQRMYRAVPESAVKEFPFLHASNLVVPLIATDVDIIFSRLMGILFGPDNLWSVRARRPDMVEFAARHQELLQWAQEAELNAYNAVADFTLEMVKLGTGVLKQRYRREMKTVYQFRESMMGNMEQFVQRLVKDSPVLEHVSLYDFLIPGTTSDIQSAPWCAERVRLHQQQYFNRVRSGIYLNHPSLQNWTFNDRGSIVLEERERLDLFRPSTTGQMELFEFWLDFDIRGMGEPLAIVATQHLPTGSIVRVDYNPFVNQEKPYSAARFMRQEKRFYGVGLAEMLEHFQEEVTTQHNQRIDSATISNAPMYKALIGSGIRQDEPTYPGRIFLLQDMGDLEPIHNQSQRFDATVQYEQQTINYAVQRTGVNDYISGAASPEIGYGTAYTNAIQSANAAKRIDQSLREVRRALAECGTRVSEMYQQFNSGGKFYEVFGEADGAILQQFLMFPMVQLRYAVGVDVTATSAALNKDMEIRTNTIIMQLLTQFWSQIVQSLSILVNPMVPMLMKNAVLMSIRGGTTMMRRLLDAHGVQDVDDLVPQIQELISGQQSALNSVSQPFGAGALPFGGAPQPPGLGGFPAGTGGVGGAGAGGGQLF